MASGRETHAAAAEVERLVRGMHADPHAVLGAHPGVLRGQRGVWVRALHPDAVEATCLPRQDGEHPMSSAGGGLFIGLMYGSLTPGFISQEEAWMLAALPLGALSTWSASDVQRAFYASTDPPWSEAFVGTMAASVFMVPMALLMAILSSKSNALAKLATLYLHNENFTSKAIEYLDHRSPA